MNSIADIIQNSDENTMSTTIDEIKEDNDVDVDALLKQANQHLHIMEEQKDTNTQYDANAIKNCPIKESQVYEYQGKLYRILCVSRSANRGESNNLLQIAFQAMYGSSEPVHKHITEFIQDGFQLQTSTNPFSS